MITGTALALDHGGKKSPEPRPQPEKEWEAIGILYVKRREGIVEFLAVYEGHVDKEIQDAIAERFGVGSLKWTER